MRLRRSKKKNRSPWKRLLIFIIFLLFLIGGYLLYELNPLSIKKIEVKINRADCITEEQVKKSTNLLGGNILLIDQEKQQKILTDKFICVGKINILRHYPDKIIIEVLGRSPAALLMALDLKEASSSATLEMLEGDLATSSGQMISTSSAQALLIDSEGVVYSKNTGSLKLPIIFYWGESLSLGKKINQKVLTDTLKVINRLKIFSVPVNQARIYLQKILVVYSTPKMIFSLEREIDPQLAALQLILEKAKMEQDKLEFVDLRFDNPVLR